MHEFTDSIFMGIKQVNGLLLLLMVLLAVMMMTTLSLLIMMIFVDNYDHLAFVRQFKITVQQACYY